MPVRLSAITVFCGASAGHDPVHAELARAVGRDLAVRGIRVVYGGGRLGLMGVLADSALRAGGEVIGVIPQGLVDRELAHRGVTRLEVVATLDERKARMTEVADGLIALPGGLGTLEELAEVASWAQLGLHDKPIGLLDADGYWSSLLAWLDQATAAGFITPVHRGLLLHDTDLERLLERFSNGPADGA